MPESDPTANAPSLLPKRAAANRQTVRPKAIPFDARVKAISSQLTPFVSTDEVEQRALELSATKDRLDGLAIVLFTALGANVPPQLRRLADRVATSWTLELNYPVSTVGQDATERKTNLRDWARRLRSRFNDRALRDPTLRMAVACILADKTDSDRAASIFIFLHASARGQKWLTRDAATSERAIFATTREALCSQRVSTGKIARMVAAIDLVAGELEELQTEFARTTEVANSSSLQLSERTLQLSAARQEAAQLKESASRLQLDLDAALADVRSARERAERIDHDWAERSKMESNQIRHGIRQFMARELDEIKKALDRPIPNMSLVTQGILNIERYIDRIELTL
jgi:hypothetical protein